uniref:Uncharacterized protein n=1 Tax=Octopus bimaculoides TaxID=37653 RepID=A0A0L8G5F5_OCTBM
MRDCQPMPESRHLPVVFQFDNEHAMRSFGNATPYCLLLNSCIAKQFIDIKREVEDCSMTSEPASKNQDQELSVIHKYSSPDISMVLTEVL